MNFNEAMQKMREKGFVFDGAKAFITASNIDRIAQDAALVTAPNAGVPAVMTTYIDPAVVEILTAPTNAREIFGETKKGDWTDTHAIFKAVEPTGESTPYTDYGNGAMADVNVTYPVRENYIAQTHIRYGEREMAVSGRAMINLASEKQKAAATIINREQNKFYLLGVAGKEIYGLLNEPNIPEALTPATVNTSVTKWEDKSTQQIYDDILTMAAELFGNSQGLIDEKSDLVLAVPPAINVLLGKATDFNVSVKDMLTKYFDNIKFVTLPELSADSGDTVMLVARSVMGMPTAQLAYSEKMRAFQLIPNTSSWEQKFAFGTYGCVLYRPFAVSSMTGV